MRRRPLPLLLGTTVLIAGVCWAADGMPEAKVTEEVLWELPAEAKVESLEVAGWGKHVAVQVKQRKKHCVIANGQPGPEYDGVEALGFDPLGQQLVYIARQNKQFMLVVDGEPQAACDEVKQLDDEGNRLIFSLLGNRMAYCARTGREWSAVVDGRAHSSYDEIEGIDFSLDGKQIAYHAREGKKWCVVVNGEAQPSYDRTERIAFSLSGEHLAYAARRGKKWVMVIDGEEGPEFDEVGVMHPVLWTLQLGMSADVLLVGRGRDVEWSRGPVAFDSQGTHSGYAGRRGKRWVVVIDGEESPECDLVGGPTISPDGERVLYQARTDGAWNLFINGERLEGYENVRDTGMKPVLSPVGKGLAFCATRGKREFVVVNGEEQQELVAVLSDPVFSSDGERVAYAARGPKKEFLVVDNRQGPGYDLALTPPEFSPDGKHVAFGAADCAGLLDIPHTWYMILDGQPSEKLKHFSRLPTYSEDGSRTAYSAATGEVYYEWRAFLDGQRIGPAFTVVRSLRFSGDGKHFAYQGASNQGWRTVTDGRLGPRYSLSGDGFWFTEDGAVQYIAVKDDAVCRVTQD